MKFTYLGVGEYIPHRWDLFVWVVFILMQPILLSLAIKQLSRNPKVKVINFVVLITSCVVLVNFITEWFLYEHFEKISEILNVLLLLIVVPISFNAVCKLFIIQAAVYNENKSYFGFKKPTNVFGLIASLVKSPYGHCFLITKGKMFKFKDSVIREIEYKHSNDYCLKEIREVPLREARKLIGSKWGYFNNCFTIFRKFK